MKNFKSVYLKASSLVLLAFCLSTLLSAQEIKSLSGANSPNDDINPVWIGNNILLFTRAFHPKNLGGEKDPGDIWMTRKNASGEWETAVHRPDLSSTGFDLALGLEDILTLLVIRQESGNVTLHQYSKFGQDWNYLRKVNFPAVQTKQGAVSGRVVEGGKQILISAVLEGGYGNEDIYISEKTGPTEWSSLTSLGPAINGKAQDMGPFFNPKKQELLFSSNSHPEATGKDILIAKKIGESWQDWSVPVKWSQISTRGSEGSVTLIEDKEVVWTSTQNSDGFADLMTFATPVPLVFPEKFEVPKNEAPVKSEAKAPTAPKTVAPSKFPESIPQMENRLIIVQEEKESPLAWYVIDGKTKIKLDFTLQGIKGDLTESLNGVLLLSELNTKGFTQIKVNSAGYFPKLVQVSSLDNKTSNLVQMTKAESGNVVLLDNVNFKRGTSELEKDQTEKVLADLAEFLKENPSLKIRINGHTDNVGDPGLNKQLSLERAGSVRDYLVSKGVEFERVRISGWGGTRPIASNVTEAGRAKNRRVELVVEN
ncbi:OmpA family protein [Algoriphagus mannitolivorans]|uniref:OmpA family protein n=1 Tax=Algoriphagus mannitolivorans TaxID=226504 RepID=UPI0003FFA100|nr:OmpA family protein [Algoriphagus mannitolivorans]